MQGPPKWQAPGQRPLPQLMDDSPRAETRPVFKMPPDVCLAFDSSLPPGQAFSGLLSLDFPVAVTHCSMMKRDDY